MISSANGSERIFTRPIQEAAHEVLGGPLAVRFSVVPELFEVGAGGRSKNEGAAAELRSSSSAGRMAFVPQVSSSVNGSVPASAALAEKTRRIGLPRRDRSQLGGNDLRRCARRLLGPGANVQRLP